MSITLYSDRFWISPWVFSCYVTLKEKGLPFEVVELALDKQETRTPGYRKRTITSKVPALDHDGFVLTESSAILEYLDESWPTLPRAFPAELRVRARARQVMSFLRTDLYALREERSTATMFYQHADQPLTGQALADADRLLDVACAFITDTTTSLFGAWSVADSELAFCLQRLGMNGQDLPVSLRQFVAAQWSRPTVQSYVQHTRAPYVAY